MATYNLSIEFVSGSYTNVTADCLQINASRSIGSFNRDIEVGAMSLTMDNFQAKYSPRKTTSPYYPYVTPGRNVRLTGTESGNTYQLFNGFITSVQINPVIGEQSALLTVEDNLTKLFDKPVNIPVAQNQLVTTYFSNICSHMGVGSYSSDTINDYLQVTGIHNTQAGEVLKEILNNTYHWLIPRASGNLLLRSRQLKAIDTTAVGSYNEFFSFGYDFRKSDIINEVSLHAEVKEPIFCSTCSNISEGAFVLQSGSNVITVDHSDPFNDDKDVYVYGAALADYEYHTSNTYTGVASYTNQCSTYLQSYGKTTVASIWNGSGATLYVNRFQLSGTLYHRTYDYSITTKDSSSQNVYGTKALIQDMNLLPNREYVSGFADWVLSQYKDNIDVVRTGLKNIYPDIFNIDVGDLIHIVESESAIANRFIVTRIDHSIDMNGIQHSVDYELAYWKPQDWFILDADHLGQDWLGF